MWEESWVFFTSHTSDIYKMKQSKSTKISGSKILWQWEKSLFCATKYWAKCVKGEYKKLVLDHGSKAFPGFLPEYFVRFYLLLQYSCQINIILVITEEFNQANQQLCWHLIWHDLIAEKNCTDWACNRINTTLVANLSQATNVVQFCIAMKQDRCQIKLWFVWKHSMKMCFAMWQ